MKAVAQQASKESVAIKGSAKPAFASPTFDSGLDSPVFERKTCPCGGGCPRCLPLQKKLAIGAVDDPLEHEADRIADHIMRMPDPTTRDAANAAGNKLQRKCACGGSSSSGECEECEKKNEGPLQRLAIHAAPAVGVAPPIVHDVLRSPGHPLDDRTRAFFEPRFGHDFHHIRVSSDDTSAAAADAIHAKAFTFGNRIVFGRNEYDPHSASGLGLIAHELAHTAQQRSAPALATSMLIGGLTDPQEREADLAANAVLNAGRIPSLSSGAATVRRQPQGYSWKWNGDNEGEYTSPGGAKYTVTRTSEPVTQSVPTQFIPGLDFAKAYVTITWCKDPIQGTVEAGVDITNQLQQLVPQILATGDPARVLRDANLTPYVRVVAIQSEKGTFNFDIQADVGRQGLSAVRVGGGVDTPKGRVDVTGGVSGLGPGEHPFLSGNIMFTPGPPATKIECKTKTYKNTFKCQKAETVPGFDLPVDITLPNPARTRYLYFDYAQDIITSSRNQYGKDHPNIVARNEATYADLRKDFDDGYRVSAIAGFTSPEGPMPKPKDFKPGMFEGNIELAKERAKAALDFFAMGRCGILVETACFSPNKAGVRVEGKGELYTYIDEGREAEGKPLADVAVPEFLAREGAGLTDKEREALAKRLGAPAQSDIVYPLLRRAEITLTKAPAPVHTTIHFGEFEGLGPAGECPAEVQKAAAEQFKSHDKSPKTP